MKSNSFLFGCLTLRITVAECSLIKITEVFLSHYKYCITDCYKGDVIQHKVYVIVRAFISFISLHGNKIRFLPNISNNQIDTFDTLDYIVPK